MPACPDWSGRNLIALMIGVGADALTGDIPDDTNPGWTRHHLEQRTGTVTDLLTDWAQNADAIETFVGAQDPTPLVDILIHEQDLHGALNVSGAREIDGQAVVRIAMLQQIADALQGSPADRAIVIRATDTDWSWQYGDEPSMTVVETSLFQLTRAFSSRRTADQLRSWTTTGSIESYLDAFATVGLLPSDPLPE